MDESATIENVCQAIDALKSPNSEISSMSAKWLAEFQKTVFAWKIADEILGACESVSDEACLLAAQIIRQKVLQDFSQLPVDYYASLSDSLFNHLCSIEKRLQSRNTNTTPILLQISAALSDLFIQVPGWTGVNKLLSRLTQFNGSSPKTFLIFLKTFAEEIYNKQLRIGQNRRTSLEDDLAEQTANVINVLSQICQSQTGSTAEQSRAIYCLSSLLLNKRIKTEIVAQSELFRCVLETLKDSNCNSDVNDAATECVVNALFLIEEPRKHYELAKLLLSSISDTVSVYNLAIANEDHDKLQNYARLYVELCESFITEICISPGEDIGSLMPLNLLLMLLDYHDFNLIEMSFNIWYRLSEYLYQCEENDFRDLRQVFIPYIERYINGLCRHCRVGDTDMAGLIEPNNDIVDFREKAAESVKDVAFIIGSIDLLKKLMNLLHSSKANSWDDQEAVLFVISTFAHIIERENDATPQLVKEILALPIQSSHVQLLSTASQILGNLQCWLCENHAYIPQVMQWLLLLARTHPILLKTLAASIELICERAAKYLRSNHGEYIATFLQLISLAENDNNQTGNNMEGAVHHFIRASAHIINNLPAQYIILYLQQLCLRPIERLNELNRLQSQQSLNDSENSHDENKKPPESRHHNWQQLTTDPVLWLDRLSAIFRILHPWNRQADFNGKVTRTFGQNGFDLNDNNNNDDSLTPRNRNSLTTDPVVPWLEQSTSIMQTLSSTLHSYQTNQRVQEHACRAIRFIIRSMGVQSIVFIEPLANQIVEIYRKHPHSCFLYLASILVDEYGKVEEIQRGLIAMLNVLSEKSFEVLRQADGLQNQPETVDDLYRLSARFVQRIPDVFISEPIAASLFEGSLMAIKLDHIDANRSVSKFVQEMIQISKPSKSEQSATPTHHRSQELLNRLGPQLMFAIIDAALFRLSNALIREMAEIVILLLEYNRESASKWIELTCAQLPHDNHGLGNTASLPQISVFKSQVSSALKIYDVVDALRNLSKLYG